VKNDSAITTLTKIAMEAPMASVSPRHQNNAVAAALPNATRLIIFFNAAPRDSFSAQVYAGRRAA
jgi:hypothetical protein